MQVHQFSEEEILYFSRRWLLVGELKVLPPVILFDSDCSPQAHPACAFAHNRARLDLALGPKV